MDGGPETVRKELTLKDVVDQAVETGTFDELRTPDPGTNTGSGARPREQSRRPNPDTG